ncbi:hypothetical protein Tco_1577610 [Tanacetum coccineum]
MVHLQRRGSHIVYVIAGRTITPPKSDSSVRLSIERPADRHQWVLKDSLSAKPPASNLRRIQVKDIVKEVEDHLKTYSSAGMDIGCTGGSHVTNVPAFDKDDFTSWKIKFLVFLDALEPYLITTLVDGLFVPMSNLSTPANPLPKCQNQWSNAESRLVNQDKRLKIIIISCLPNDVMKSVIKYKSAKEMWTELCLAYEGSSNTRDTKIAALRLKFNAFKALEDSDSDVEEDNRTSNEFMADLNAEYHERALWQIKVGSQKEDEGTTKFKAFMVIVDDDPSVGKG